MNYTDTLFKGGFNGKPTNSNVLAQAGPAQSQCDWLVKRILLKVFLKSFQAYADIHPIESS